MKSSITVSLIMVLMIGSSSLATTWEQTWKYEVEPGTTVLDAVQDLRSIIFVTTDGIEAVSLDSGKKLWSHSFPDGDALIGLPVIGEGMAVYVTYMGKKYKGRSESGDALISALDLGSGMVIWSSYLPEYLPFGKAISNGQLFLACQSAPKLLTPTRALRLFERAKGERPDAWLLNVDLATGDLRWHLHSRQWAEFLAKGTGGDFIVEHIGSDENPRTRLSKHRSDTGDAIWTANDKDPTNLHSTLNHPRGVLFLSDGYSGTYSHLRHPDSGEEMARLELPYSGASVRRMDTLWVYGLRESMTFASTRELTAVDWAGLRPLRTQQLKPSAESVDDVWFQSDQVSTQLKSNPAFWTVYRHRYTIPQRSLDLDRNGKRIIIPNETPSMPDPGAVFSENGFALAERTADGAVWSYYTLGGADEPIWSVEGKGDQPPVWMPYDGGGEVVSAIDGTVISFASSNGRMDTLLTGAPGMALKLLSDGGNFFRIGTTGLAKYTPIQEIPTPEPEPELEPIVISEPEPPIVTPVFALPPVTKPESVIIPEPKPVIVPEPKPVVVEKPAMVQGWRIQIMYLASTSRSQAEKLAQQASTLLGLNVEVVPRNGALLLLAGQFTDENTARVKLRQVRRTEYKDAFLIRAQVSAP
ncbi:MAG: PQQ-binding-like beta-propeller repeat protein [bacterium]